MMVDILRKKGKREEGKRKREECEHRGANSSLLTLHCKVFLLLNLEQLYLKHESREGLDGAQIAITIRKLLRDIEHPL